MKVSEALRELYETRKQIRELEAHAKKLTQSLLRSRLPGLVETSDGMMKVKEVMVPPCHVPSFHREGSVQIRFLSVDPAPRPRLRGRFRK